MKLRASCFLPYRTGWLLFRVMFNICSLHWNEMLILAEKWAFSTSAGFTSIHVLVYVRHLCLYHYVSIVFLERQMEGHSWIMRLPRLVVARDIIMVLLHWFSKRSRDKLYVYNLLVFTELPSECIRGHCQIYFQFKSLLMLSSRCVPVLFLCI